MRGLGGLIGFAVVLSLLQTDPGSLFVFLFLVMAVLLVIGAVCYGCVALFEGMFGGDSGGTSGSSSGPSVYEISIPYWTLESNSSKPKPSKPQRTQPTIDCLDILEEEDPAVFPIDINNASIDELQRIPFIGEAKAFQIAHCGPYKTINDLAQLVGFGECTIHRISEFITVGELPEIPIP